MYRGWRDRRRAASEAESLALALEVAGDGGGWLPPGHREYLAELDRKVVELEHELAEVQRAGRWPGAGAGRKAPVLVGGALVLVGPAVAARAEGGHAGRSQRPPPRPLERKRELVPVRRLWDRRGTELRRPPRARGRQVSQLTGTAADWRKVWDAASGRFYYYHRGTQETVWDAPQLSPTVRVGPDVSVADPQTLATSVAYSIGTPPAMAIDGSWKHPAGGDYR